MNKARSEDRFQIATHSRVLHEVKRSDQNSKIHKKLRVVNVRDDFNDAIAEKEASTSKLS